MNEHEAKNKRDLEPRLIQFAIVTVKLTEGMPTTRAGTYYAGQLLRSGGAPALIYGEAQGGESHKDLTHKIKMVHKELRESHVCLRIIHGAQLHPDLAFVERTLQEAGELVAIFTASVKTAERRSPRSGS
jgi:four helix bundle protein